MKENSIEEDIEILEEMIENANIENMDMNNCFGGEHIEAIEHILSDYKKMLKEIEGLKEKYDKDTHTLQNQLDIANAEIDLMANFMNKRSWKEHQVKDDICWCCKIEYASEECVKCIKQYFKKKVGN